MHAANARRRACNFVEDSLVVKVKLADLELVGFPGLPPVISTTGGVPSTVHVRLARRVVGSVDRSHREGVRPVGELVVGLGEVQSSKTVVELAWVGSLAVKVKLADRELVRAGGVEVIETVGGVASIVHV